MLDLGWSEMAVIALVALVVLGPKEIPNALRTVALWARKARKLAREFQSGVDELVREAELDEAKKSVQSISRVNVNREMEKAIDPTGDLSRAMRSDAPAGPAGIAEEKPGTKPEGGEVEPVGGNGRGSAAANTSGAAATPLGTVSSAAGAAPPSEPAPERAEAPSKSA